MRPYVRLGDKFNDITSIIATATGMSCFLY